MIKCKLNRVLFLGLFALFLMVNYMNAQESGYELKGIILSRNGIPVSNVSVSYERSETEPVISDEAGEFTLKVTSGNVYLIIKPVEGFHSKRKGWKKPTWRVGR